MICGKFCWFFGLIAPWTIKSVSTMPCSTSSLNWTKQRPFSKDLHHSESKDVVVTSIHHYPLFSCFLSLSLSFLLFIPFILFSRNLKISETLCAVVHYFLHPYPRYSLMPSYTYWTSPRYFTYFLPGGEALDSLAENFESESVWRKSNCFSSQIYGFMAFMAFMLKRFRKK